MNERELRIGNLVKVEEKTIQVECIFSDRGINELYDYDNGFQTEYSFDEIKPIQLTEEWLLKLGFSRYGTQEGIYRVYSGCLYKHVGFHQRYPDLLHIYLSDLKTIIMTVKYVHELQNIIYCLTREELTIKELSK